MKRYLQSHALTFYPPSNLNRDDTNRPKTAIVGGVERLRIASQCIKRAWRKSDVFAEALAGHLGERTTRLGDEVLERLRTRLDDVHAVPLAQDIAAVFGKVIGRVDAEAAEAKKEAAKTANGKGKKKPAGNVRIEQLAFVSREERDRVMAFVDQATPGQRIDPKAFADAFLLHADTSIDIALFGRMLASNTEYGRDGAAQVSHAITTHKASPEDDFYTAMDDRPDPTQGGAAFMDVQQFGSGVFYSHVGVDLRLLIENLGGDAKLAADGIAALIEAMATVSPTGKQHSFAARCRASYVLAEVGDSEPLNLAVAFAKPVTGDDLMSASIDRLRSCRQSMGAMYGGGGASAEAQHGGAGSLAAIISFVREQMSCAS